MQNKSLAEKNVAKERWSMISIHFYKAAKERWSIIFIHFYKAKKCKM